MNMWNVDGRFDFLQARLWSSAKFPSKGKSHEDASLPRCFSGPDADADADTDADADADTDADHRNEKVCDIYFRFPITLSWSHWKDFQLSNQESILGLGSSVLYLSLDTIGTSRKSA